MYSQQTVSNNLISFQKDGEGAMISLELYILVVLVWNACILSVSSWKRIYVHEFCFVRLPKCYQWWGSLRCNSELKLSHYLKNTVWGELLQSTTTYTELGSGWTHCGLATPYGSACCHLTQYGLINTTMQWQSLEGSFASDNSAINCEH